MAPPPLKSWRVTSRKNLTDDVFELTVERPNGTLPDGTPYHFSFRGGQYVSIVIPGAGPGGRNLRRAYSIASPPEQSAVDLCVKVVEGGPGTSYLNTLQAGSEFQGQAPFGDFVLEHDQVHPTLFIGTGTGLAPLRSMILSAEWTSKAPVGFLLGVRSQKDIVYPEMFGHPYSDQPQPAQLKGQKHVHIALSRPEGPWNGFKGRVTDYLRQMEWDFASSHYYLCGSGAMIAEIKEILINSKGVNKEQIHTEKYF